MDILIDGYNLMKTTQKTDRASERQIRSFIAQLGSYSQISGNRVVLVFDGGPDLYPTKERHNGISVIYSGVKDTADDVIKSYLDQHKGENVLLVSTDRVLDAHALSQGIEFIDSADFYRLMLQRLEPGQEERVPDNSGLKKIATDSTPELDQLMEEASEQVVVKEEESERPRERSRVTLSKKERRKMRKVSKI